MRVLFLPIPGIGHSFPAVPLAWALRSAGHEVLFGTAFDGLAVDKAGLPVVDLRLGAETPEVFAEITERYPELSQKIRGDHGSGLSDLDEAVPVFADIATQFVDPVVELALAWRPDLIVHTGLHGVALVAAAKLGVPAVALGDGFGRAAHLATAMYDHMSEAFAAVGAAGLSERRQTLDVAPPSMVGGVPEGLSMRYIPYNGGAVVPDWLPPGSRAPERPRICVTLGSVRPKITGLERVEPLLAAAGDVDAEFLLALGEVDTTSLGTLPRNVRIVGWVPLSVVLPTCTALVHHGGGGSTFTALALGVTQLVIPGGGDSNINADAVVERGLGMRVTAEEVDSALLCRLATDDKMQAAAAEVRAEIAAMPSPADVVHELVRLVNG
jgi:UDP:flavonoid glycosyltransferase YjiC (YdhE family)